MLNEEKIPVALEAIWQSLERIAEALENLSERGVKVRPLSPECMKGDHDSGVDGCFGCGCDCHRKAR